MKNYLINLINSRNRAGKISRKNLSKNLANQRGDTLVEVLIAITILGIVVAGALAIMNRSLVTILNSAERTAVRAEINGQVELLNYARFRSKSLAPRDETGVEVADTPENTLWAKIKSVAFTGTAANVANAARKCNLQQNGRLATAAAAGAAGSFYMNLSGANVSVATNLKVNNDNKPTAANPTDEGGLNGKNLTSRATLGKGIWIDAVYYPVAAGNTVPYFDFYIKACWTPLGNMPDSNSVTIVRIYDKL